MSFIYSYPSKLLNTNLDAFHNLFAKLLAASNFSGIYLISLPGEIPKY